MATVLVLNDEPDLIAACQMVLEANGYCAVGTTDPSEALPLAARLRPDVILLDWVMPGTYGDEILRVLRSQPATAHIPVIMMSALIDGEARSQAAGADAFLAKPFDVEQLAQAIESFVDRARPGAAPR